MGLTPEEEARLRRQARMESAARWATITSSFVSFMHWLQYDVPDLYRTVKHKTQEVWEWLRVHF